MKSLKTFNLDQDVIRIVKQKHNQSQFVCKAIRKLHNSEESFSYQDIETKRLYVLIFNRMSANDPLKALILERINTMKQGDE